MKKRVTQRKKQKKKELKKDRKKETRKKKDNNKKKAEWAPHFFLFGTFHSFSFFKRNVLFFSVLF